MKGNKKAFNILKRGLTLFCALSLLLSETASVSMGADLNNGTASASSLNEEVEGQNADKPGETPQETGQSENGSKEGTDSQSQTGSEGGAEASGSEGEGQSVGENPENNSEGTKDSSDAAGTESDEGATPKNEAPAGNAGQEGTVSEGDQSGNGGAQPAGTDSGSGSDANAQESQDAAGSKTPEPGSDAASNEGTTSKEETSGTNGTDAGAQTSSGNTSDKKDEAGSIESASGSTSGKTGTSGSTESANGNDAGKTGTGSGTGSATSNTTGKTGTEGGTGSADDSTTGKSNSSDTKGSTSGNSAGNENSNQSNESNKSQSAGPGQSGESTKGKAAVSGSVKTGSKSSPVSISGEVETLDGTTTKATYKAVIGEGLAVKKYEWTADSEAVALSTTNEKTDQVTVTAVDGKKGGDVVISLKVTLTDDTDQTATKMITVNTARAVNTAITATDYKNVGRQNVSTAVITETLSIPLTAAPGAEAEATDSDVSAYTLQWQKKNEDGKTYTDIKKSTEINYKPSAAGTYRVHITREADEKNHRLAYDGYSGDVVVSPLPVKVIWESYEKEYDGLDTIRYSGSAKVKRSDDDHVIDALTASTTLQPIYLGSADAKSYSVNVDMGKPTTNTNISSDSYTVVSSTLSVTIYKASVAVTVKGTEKNFDGRTELTNLPVIEVTPSKDKNGKPLTLLVNGNAPNKDCFSYTSAGKVDEDTEGIKFGFVGENVTVSIAVDGEESNNYVPKVSFEELGSVIKKNNFLESDVVATVDGKALDAETTIWWSKSGNKVTVASKEGFTIASALDGSYEQTLTIDASDNATIYAKNAAGEIGLVGLTSLKMDDAVPTVNLTNTEAGTNPIFFNNKEVKNTYEIVDKQSGIARIAYTVLTEMKSDLVYDESTWETVTFEDETTATITLTVPRKGYVYFYAEDKVGNKEISYKNMVVVENQAPKMVSANVDNDKARQAHTVTLTAQDQESDDHTVSFSGLSQITVQVFEGNGNEVTDTAVLSVGEEGFGIDPNTKSIVREETPKDLAGVEAAKEMAVNLTVSGVDGVCTMKVTAVDYCGNKSEETEVDLNFDNTPPVVTVTASGYKVREEEEKKAYYFGASEEKKIAVTFEDANISVGGTYWAVISNTQGEVAKKILNDPEAGEGDSGIVSNTKGELVVDNSYLSTLPDGEYTLTVKAVDDSSNDAKGVMMLGEEELTSYHFTLDQTAPRVKAVSVTIDDDGAMKNLEAVGEGRLPRYMFSRPFSVNITIEDKNIDISSMTATSLVLDSEELDSIKAPGISEPGLTTNQFNNQEFTVTYALSVDDEGKVASSRFIPVILGEDYAGNVISLNTNIADDDPYKWQVRADGTGVELSHELWYQAEEPLINLSFKKGTDDLTEANVLDNTAYYNGDITVIAALKNIAEEEYKEISLTVRKTGLGEREAKEKTFTLDALKSYIDENKTLELTLPLNKSLDAEAEEDENAAYQISFAGCNIYGNPVKVTVSSPTGNEERQEGEFGGESSSYLAPWTLVRDTVNPEVSVLYTPKEEVANSAPVKGGHYNNDNEYEEDVESRYYFNTGFDAQVVVEDYSLSGEASSITVKRAAITVGGESSAATAEGEDHTGTTTEEGDSTVSTTEDANSEAAAIHGDYSEYTFNVDAFKNGNLLEGSYNQETAKAFWMSNESSEGIYGYAVYGCDLAGNPVVVNQAASSDGTVEFARDSMDFTDSRSAEDTKNGASRNDPAKKALVTVPAVIDMTAPVGKISIFSIDKKKGTKKLYYAKDTNNDLYESLIYIQNESAYISASVNDEERLPVTISLKVNEKKGTIQNPVSTDAVKGKNLYKVGDQYYVYGAASDYTVDGEQIFTVTDFVVTDLAGNSSPVMADTDLIYIDKSAPTQDIFKPAITITTTIPNNNYNNEGEKLFNGDAPFLITVTEPLSSAVMKTNEDGTSERAYLDEECASSGLRKVSYTLNEITSVTTDEAGNTKEKLKKLESKELYSFSDSSTSDETSTAGNNNTQNADRNYLYQYKNEEPIVISAASYNQNNLVLTVTAEDNAGNTTKSNYHFGIDTTPPEILVEYDNNEVHNGRYFKGDRKATITVTERNFVAPDIRYKGISYEEEVKITESSKWTYTKGKSDNGDDDTYTKTITFSGDGDFTFSIVSLSDAAGNESYELNMTKEGTKVPWDFTIDKKAPKVVVTMGGKPYSSKEGEDNKYYYKADNGGITATISDHGHDMGVGGNSPEPVYRLNVYKETVKEGKVVKELVNSKSFVPNGEYTREKEEKDKVKEVKLEYSAKEVAGFIAGYNSVVGANNVDGSYIIEIEARDISGREQEKLDGTSKGCIFKDMTGSFILDTTPPSVTAVVTKPLGKGTATDGKYYEDTKAVYYNQQAKVTFTVSDQYAATGDFKGSVMETANKASADDAKGSGDNNDLRKKVKPTLAAADNSTITLEFALGENKTYKSMVISGKDKAGNRLVLADGYAHSGEADVLSQAGTGSVKADHGKVIDTEKPKLTIQYSSKDRANLYTGEKEGKTSAYYNKDITVSIKVTDNYELDGKKLTIGREDDKSAGPVTVPVNRETKASENSYTHSDIVIKEEGRSSYTGYGTDRALNPVVVSEQIPLTEANRKVTYLTTETTLRTKTLRGRAYAAKYELVLDKTAPTFVMAVASPESTNKDLNTQGNRYYFNKGFSTTVTVTDTNVDSNRVKVRLGTVAGNTYDSSKAVVTAYPTEIAVGTTARGKLTYRSERSQNGVYRYAVYGSDKAGNALVPKETTNLDGSSTGIVNASTESAAGSLEREADTSNHIVIDTVSPAGTFYVAEGNADYFTFRSDGNTVSSAPFRDENSANLRFDVDETVERSPVKVEYVATAQPATYSKTTATAGYVYNPTLRSTQSGRQQFKLTNLTLTDLAGNVTKAASKNSIYLDTAPASNDIIPPTVEIVATAASGVRGGHGQPLYKKDVTLQLHVSDPYPNASSSGIADVRADIYVNGSLVSDTRTLHQANQKTFTGNYTDPALLYDQTWAVTLSASQYNYNDIRVVAHATDNAGNVSTDATYQFGIDITPPEIAVSYDNNNVRNDKYFKADRTATVVVTERNFEAGKINITTQSGARISGWSHTSGSRANGDDDKWTATISYTADGPYTLSLAGADQLGWNASSVSYAGQAPRDFILDKTAPVVSVEYDNNDVRNEKYYKADRTATISVEEVNFAGENEITVTEAGNGPVPEVAFSDREARLPFDKDGVYSFGGTVTDLAGNVSEVFKEAAFVIDKTKPRLTYEGVEDLSANRDPIQIALRLLDTNLKDECIEASLVGTNNGEVDLAFSPLRIEGGVQYDLPAIDVDDYYKLSFTGTDLAGNQVSDAISFSENQNGTVFVFDMKDQLKSSYTNQAFKPQFTLYNVDEVTILSVTLNGQEVDYDYKNNILTFAEAIERDGKYTIGIDVKDAAGNISSMEPLEFYLDTKPPIISQTGLELQRDGDYNRVYSEPFELRLIHDIPEDAFAALYVNGNALKIDDYITESGAVILPVNKYMPYKVELVVTDVAGNESRAEWEFELTSNPLKIWVNNKPVFYTSLALTALLAGGLIFFLMRRRRQAE